MKEIGLYDGKTIRYDYYTTGARKSVEVLDSSDTRIYYNLYTYDEAGRLKTVNDAETGTVPPSVKTR